MYVYAQERRDGLEGALRGPRRVTLAAGLRLSEVPADRLAACVRRAAGAAPAQEELVWAEAVLVTAGWRLDESRGLPFGWNRNDDCFDPTEVWAARATPEDKPVNDEHDSSRIVGHIVSNRAADLAGAELPMDCAPDELPDAYHLVTGAVLYKVWPEADLQERFDRLLAAAAAGERHVSMECLFRGFDYVLMDGGLVRVVARGKDTAHLTRHLRCYGGTGEYQGMRIGRLVRNISFSGMGVVARPANPSSVFLSVAASAGYATENEPNREVAMERELAELRVERDSLAGELAAARDRLTQAEAELGSTRARLAEAETELGSTRARATEAEAELGSTRARLAEAEAGAAAAEARARRVERRATALEATGGDASLADELAETLSALSDESFSRAMTAWTTHNRASAGPATNNPQSGNTAFKGGTAKAPPQSTPAPTAPRSTPAPAPMHGKADVADLDGATPRAEPALAADVPAAETVRQHVAAYFGRTETE